MLPASSKALSGRLKVPSPLRLGPARTSTSTARLLRIWTAPMSKARTCSSRAFTPLSLPHPYCSSLGFPCAVACSGNTTDGSHLLLPAFSLALVFDNGSLAIFEGKELMHCSMPVCLKRDVHVIKYVLYMSTRVWNKFRDGGVRSSSHLPFRRCLTLFLGSLRGRRRRSTRRRRR